MSQEIKTVTNYIDKLTAVGIPKDPKVKNKFITLYKVFHGKAGEMVYEAEQFHFLKRLQENPELQKCTKLSIMGAFLDVSVSGLSFDPTMKHLSLVKFGDKLVVMYGAAAELVLRQRQKQVKYIDNPTIVYEGDEFSIITKDNATTINHVAKFPRKEKAAMQACFVKITRNDGTIDYKVMTFDELMKIRQFSKSPNSSAWSEAGLPGMFRTKTIKHAFNNYPKLRLGDFSKLETEVVETEDGPETFPEVGYSLDESQEEKKPEIFVHPESPAQKRAAQSGIEMPFEEVKNDTELKARPSMQPSDAAKKVEVDLTSDSANDDIFN